MKKLFFILAVLLAVTFMALQAQSVVFISGTSGGGAACSWSTVWDGETVSGNSNWADYDQADKNYRLVIDSTDTGGTTGTKVRITLMAHSSTGTVISAASFGLGTPGGSAFDSAPVNVTFSSSDSVTMTADQTLVSDEITITYDTDEDYMIALATDGSMQYVNANPPEAYSYDTSADETETLNPAGYVGHNYLEIITLVEACQ